MIAQFAAAVTFLTRLPVGRRALLDAKAVGESARWFPLVGALLGGIYVGILKLFCLLFPALITAALLTAIDAFLTGAMHLDGVADAADGFGGGHTRQDTLRIMRDHAIGSYGAVALSLVIVLKVAAIGALIGGRAVPALLLAPVLGRWSAVLSSVIAGYARPREDDSPRSVGAPARSIGRTELLIATLTAGALAVLIAQWRGVAVLLLATAGTLLWTWLCRRRIGGITGDTLGAGIVMSECLVLVFFTSVI